MELPPLAIAAVGLIVVLGTMLVLRMHAFLSLLMAALVVSLLAPGPIEYRVRRVAEAFGSTAGSIGIVIALAAIIGKCAMDSGAADRVVRTALRIFGEKRAPTALCSAGFALAIPVFFDTVFYLLVPLARSLYRQTKKNYVLYVTAISCGGAITHTLVPPTPGPLFMAERFGIDLGVMILVGVLIGIPTAAVGLVVCRALSRWTDAPMRGNQAEASTENLSDSQLPPLWLAAAPVVLPVALISLNTFASAWADAERAARISVADIRSAASFKNSAVDQQSSPSKAVGQAETIRRLTERLNALGLSDPGSASPDQMAEGLNQLLTDRTLFASPLITEIPAEADALQRRGLDRLSAAEVEHFNRLIIEAHLPELLEPHRWNTRRRRFAQLAACLGDANLALFLAAAVALSTLARYRSLSLRQLTSAAEEALLSAGGIILITAAGGAFGAMLRESGLREAVAVGFSGTGSGFGVMAAAFAVAAMLKTAQGSSTVAIMTTTAMFAAAGIDATRLGFHLAYLAASIAGGSLVGSWMNDSGFWIYSRMSGLTETETLRTWTPLLVALGTTTWLLSSLAAWLFPLV